MRNDLPPQHQSGIPAAAAPGFRRLLAPRSLGIPAAGALLMLIAALAPAQTPANSAPTGQASAARAHKTTHIRKRAAAHLAPPPAPEPVAPVAPPVPETPKWPAFEKAGEASVEWDSHGLVIRAANSSLEQIMHDVATATGAKVEGLAADERVFGQYGPGRARDVLSELLQGSGYNVIMIGDQGQGTPRQILLSVRQAAGAQPQVHAPTTTDEDDTEEPSPNQEPTPGRFGFPPGGPRNPQQFQQEMRERQQQQPYIPNQPNQPPQPQY